MVDENHMAVENFVSTGLTGPDFVLARFHSTAMLDDALQHLETSGFDREDLGLPDLDRVPELVTPELETEAANAEVDAQQSRVVISTVSGSFAALMAACVVVATGGIALAVAGAALGAGAAVAGVTNLTSRALSHHEQQARETRAAEGKLILAVRTISEERRARATGVLQACGAEVL